MLQFRAETAFLFSRMSKLQLYPAVPRSIDVRGLSLGTGSAGLGVLLLASGCLSANVGMGESTQVVLSTSTGENNESDSTGGSGIMTTTVDPDRTTGDSDGSESAAGTDTSSGETSGTTTGISVMCGDGVKQADEECDAGDANADDGDCTSHCKNAVCGDGLLLAGVEVCDDSINDGSYNGCATDCLAQGPRCGDGQVQGPQEKCDDSNATSGCLPETCTLAKSCKEIKDAYLDQAADGVHTIAPLGAKVQVVCDMDADGGGYTFLKVAQADPVGAKAAEVECAKYGMRLLVPRSKVHLTAAVLVAISDVLAPVGEGVTKSSLNYLKMFGIYPKVAGQSCSGKPLNNVACPQWSAVGDVFWVSDSVPAAPLQSEPGIKTCVQCSMEYYWNPNGTLSGYESLIGNNNEGYKGDLFMCEVPDMLPLK